MNTVTKTTYNLFPHFFSILLMAICALTFQPANSRNLEHHYVGDNTMPVNLTSSGGIQAADYATLNEAFTAVNNGMHTGMINITVSGNTTETITASLNASGMGNASYSGITIHPSGNIVISGDLAAPLIQLAGADNVIIDGFNSNGNSLTIQNMNTGGITGTSTIQFIFDAINNTITNCIILGSATVNIAAGNDGANIWFSTGIGTGNDNNTISQCVISAASGGLPVRLIQSSGSTTSTNINNSGITVSGCDLSDCFNAGSVSRMIDIGSGSTDISITGNKLYQTDVRTQTTGTEYRIISISNPLTGNNFHVTANTIGHGSASSTGTFGLAGVAGTRLVPVYINAASATGSVISNNIITAISLSGNLNGTLASAPFCGIQVAAGLTEITGNTIGASAGNNAVNITTSGALAADICGIYNAASSPATISANIIGSVSAGTLTNAAFNLYGIRAKMNLNAPVIINNNIIGSKTTVSSFNNTSFSSASARVIAIQNDASATFTINGNTIANVSTDAQNSSGSSPAVVGIRQAANSTVAIFTGTISNDTIYDLGCTDPLAGIVVTGLHLSGSTASGTSVTVSNNIIHSFSNPSASSFAELRGLYIVGGRATFQNNMISLGTDGVGNTLSNNLSIYGVFETGGINNFYFNTVYIGGSGVNGTNKCYAMRSLTTGVNRLFKNNIFQNSRTGSGKYYAIQLSGSGANPSGLTSNNNKFFAEGSGGVLGLYGGADRVSLAAWQAATGQDATSIYVDPALKTPAGNSSSLDLHVDMYASSSENEGTTIAGITTDIDAESRDATTPDMGADEYSLSPCSAANAGIVTVSVSDVCNSGSATLAASGFVTGTTAQYTWEYSSDNFASDVHNLVDPVLYYSNTSTGVINSTTYYRHKVTCSTAVALSYSNIVAVTVHPSTANISASSTTVCAGTSVTLTENGGTANAWNWNTAETSQSIVVTPNVTTTYSVNTGGAGNCDANGSVTIIVNPLPASVSALASSSAICAGNPVNLFSTGNSVSPVILNEDFNGATNAWNKINNSAGGDFLNAAWTLRPDSYLYSGTNATFHSNDNSQFYLSNSDDQNAGDFTETILESPLFSLAGYTNADLSYFHHFSWFTAADLANVEISANDGATWTLLRTWTSDQGTESSFVNDVINLNAYVNQRVKIRFRYSANFGNYWAIDNVSVTGAPAPVNFSWSSIPEGFMSNEQSPSNVISSASTDYIVTASTAAGCSSTASTSVTVSPGIIYYLDNDADGFGNAAISQVSCIGAPSGYAANNTDCDDNNSNIHPGADEICGNGLDDNCDGQTDEGCGQFTFFRDSDTDGFGDPVNTTTNTTGIPPLGYVSNNTDCNDNSAAIHPGALEICNGVDDDCDGSIDETTLKASSVAGTIGCAGGNTTVTVSATGGSGIYTGTGVFTVSAGPYSFTVTDSHGCSSVTTGTVAPGTGSGSVPASPTKISGTTLVMCGGGDFTYTVPRVSGATSFTWTVPAGFNVVQNSGRSAIIRVPAIFTTAVLSVTANNACGASEARSVTLFAVGPDPTSSITGPTTVAAGQSGVVYKLPSATGLTFTWTVPPGATITNGQGTSKIRVRFGSTSGNITVVATNACGSSPTGIRHVTVGSSIAASFKQSTPVSGGNTFIKAYPNPAQSVSNIVFNYDRTGVTYNLVVTDLRGHTIINKTGITIKGKNSVQLDIGKYANAMYVVKLIAEGDIRTVKLYKEK